MPAAAVIPAPTAYIKVAAVKKLVVGFRKEVVAFSLLPLVGERARFIPLFLRRDLKMRCVLRYACASFPHVTVNKSECSTQAFAP